MTFFWIVALWVGGLGLVALEARRPRLVAGVVGALLIIASVGLVAFHPQTQSRAWAAAALAAALALVLAIFARAARG
jgi:membrane-bound ClpP family serine protease